MSNLSTTRKKAETPNPAERLIVSQKAEKILRQFGASKIEVKLSRILERVLLLEKDDI